MSLFGRMFWVAGLLLVYLVVGPVAVFAQGAPDESPPVQVMSLVGQVYGPVPLYRVLDGDTIVVMSNVGPRTVRLIGIDAPEISGGQPGAREADRYLAQLLGSGTLLWLELDHATEDLYGRLLAYVYIPDIFGQWEYAGLRLTQVNLAMAQSGWVHTLAIEPSITYADLYEEAVAAAMAAGLGLWAQAGNGPTVRDEAGAEGGSAHYGGEAAGLDDLPIRIHCGLLNPVADNDVGEWVSVLLTKPMETRGYYLFDQGSRAIFRLPAGEQPAGEIRIHNPGQGVWNNSGDTVYLMRGGEVIDSWTYQGHEARSGVVVCRAD